jgi:hypothetical protein
LLCRDVVSKIGGLLNFSSEAQQKLMLKLKTTYYQVKSEYCAKVVSILLSAKYRRPSNEIFLFLLLE